MAERIISEQLGIPFIKALADWVSVVIERPPSVDPIIITYLDVCHPMIVQVGAGGKSLPTDWTLVRFLARVDPSMRIQRT